MGSTLVSNLSLSYLCTMRRGKINGVWGDANELIAGQAAYGQEVLSLRNSAACFRCRHKRKKRHPLIRASYQVSAKAQHLHTYQCVWHLCLQICG
jgi:hypothetical protein